MVAPIESLPPELSISILKLLDSPSDPQAAISASPRVAAVFEAHKRPILVNLIGQNLGTGCHGDNALDNGIKIHRLVQSDNSAILADLGQIRYCSFWDRRDEFEMAQKVPTEDLEFLFGLCRRHEPLVKAVLAMKIHDLPKWHHFWEEEVWWALGASFVLPMVENCPSRRELLGVLYSAFFHLELFLRLGGATKPEGLRPPQLEQLWGLPSGFYDFRQWDDLHNDPLLSQYRAVIELAGIEGIGEYADEDDFVYEDDDSGIEEESGNIGGSVLSDHQYADTEVPGTAAEETSDSDDDDDEYASHSDSDEEDSTLSSIRDPDWDNKQQDKYYHAIEGSLEDIHVLSLFFLKCRTRVHGREIDEELAEIPRMIDLLLLEMLGHDELPPVHLTKGSEDAVSLKRFLWLSEHVFLTAFEIHHRHRPTTLPWFNIGAWDGDSPPQQRLLPLWRYG